MVSQILWDFAGSPAKTKTKTRTIKHHRRPYRPSTKPCQTLPVHQTSAEGAKAAQPSKSVQYVNVVVVLLQALIFKFLLTHKLKFDLRSLTTAVILPPQPVNCQLFDSGQ
jgi:hypothetical protein